MSYQNLIEILKELPPDQPITNSTLIQLLEALNQTSNEAYSTWDREMLINDIILAKWLKKNVKTIQNWRVIGKGPKFIKAGGAVNYKVGTVLDWIKSREVSSTTQADYYLKDDVKKK